MALILSQVLVICIPPALLYSAISPDTKMGLLALWALAMVGVCFVVWNWTTTTAVESMLGKRYRFRPTPINVTKILGCLASAALALVNHKGGFHRLVPELLVITLGVCMGVYVIVSIVDELIPGHPSESVKPPPVEPPQVPPVSLVSLEQHLDLMHRVERLDRRVLELQETILDLRHPPSPPRASTESSQEPEQPTWQERLVREDD